MRMDSSTSKDRYHHATFEQFIWLYPNLEDRQHNSWKKCKTAQRDNPVEQFDIRLISQYSKHKQRCYFGNYSLLYRFPHILGVLTWCKIHYKMLQDLGALWRSFLLVYMAMPSSDRHAPPSRERKLLTLANNQHCFPLPCQKPVQEIGNRMATCLHHAWC